MSVSTRSPLRFVGGNVFSGGPNTGQLMMTDGGAVVATVYSGGLLSPGSGFTPGAVKTADHLLLYSGAGRLDSVVLIPGGALTLSGVALVFYDSAVVAQSGPNTFQNSGYRVLGVFNAPYGVSGQITGAGPFPARTPFTSGLCVGAVSGTVGFSAIYTPEVIPSQPV